MVPGNCWELLREFMQGFLGTCVPNTTPQYFQVKNVYAFLQSVYILSSILWGGQVQVGGTKSSVVFFFSIEKNQILKIKISVSEDSHRFRKREWRKHWKVCCRNLRIRSFDPIQNNCCSEINVDGLSGYVIVLNFSLEVLL